MFPMIVVVVALAAVVKGQFSIDTCPFECNCNNTETICTSESMFPTGIPASTLYFELRDSSIREIRHGAFDNLRRLQMIKIVSSNITKLAACSLSNLQNLVKMEIVNSTIATIEGNAFSHLTNITQILFHDSRVDTMDSYAFRNIEGVDRFLFERNKLGAISPHAFINISRTVNFEIMYNKIRFLYSGVIKSMYAVTNFNFTGNNIKEMFCGNEEALLESNATAQVFNNTFNCSCALSWVLSLPENDTKIIFFKEQNYCNDTQQGELIQLSRLQLSSHCKGDNPTRGCPMQSPLLPYNDCMTDFDKPLNPVDKVDYPNKNQKPNGQTAVVMTFFQTLILVVPVFVFSITS